MQKYSVSEEKFALWVFLFVVGFIGCYWYFAFDGFYFFDDTAYSRYAWEVSRGIFSLKQNDTFAHRLGVYLPVSVIYSLTGITDYSTVLWPLLVFMAGACVLFFCLRSYSTTIALYAVVIASLNFYPVFFSNKLYPDPIVAFFTLAAAIVLWRAISQQGSNTFFQAFAFTALLFAAFLTKETVLFYTPFYLIVFIADLKSKRNQKFWGYTTALGLMILAAYFTSYYIQTGDAFYRFKVIQDGHYPFALSYYQKPFVEIIPRLTYEPLLMFLSSELAIPFIIALPLLFSFKVKDLLNLGEFESFWKVLCIVLLLMLWYCSTSIKLYNPLSLQPRMYLLMVPPLSIVAAVALAKADSKRIIFYGATFAFSAVLSYFLHINSYVVYALLTAYFAVLLFFNSKDIQYKLIPLLLILLLHPIYSMLKPTDTDYKNEKEAITKFLTTNSGNNLVLVDDQLYSGYSYYYKFAANPHYQYISYKKGIPVNYIGTIFVLINKKTFNYYTILGDAMPAFVLKKPTAWLTVFEKGDVVLYKIKSRSDFCNYN